VIDVRLTNYFYETISREEAIERLERGEKWDMRICKCAFSPLSLSRSKAVIELPAEIREWLVKVFSIANSATSGHLTRVPNVHEPHLDTTLISTLGRFAVPFVFPSDWIIRIDTHFLGSSNYWGRWEIADIGLLVNFRRAGQLLRTKVALLQSKRLYPNERVEKNPEEWRGFGKLMESDDVYARAVAPRTFTFAARSRYKALQIDDGQYQAIASYEDLSQIPVYYLFHNPFQIPADITLPAATDSDIGTHAAVGCRVLPAYDFREVVAPSVDGLTPSYGDVCGFESGTFAEEGNRGGWRFETFVVDELLGCRRGYRADRKADTTLANLFGGRSAPIFAAISVNVDAPANAPESSIPE
jgi:hypothetical protein